MVALRRCDADGFPGGHEPALDDELSPKGSEAEASGSGKLLRTAEAHLVLDAIYVEEPAFGDWARGVVRAAARAVHACTDAHIEVLDGGTVVRTISTEEAGVRAPERITLDVQLRGSATARLSMGCAGRSSTTASERMLLTRIGLHLENAMRLRSGAGQRCIALDAVTSADRMLWASLRNGRISVYTKRRGAQPLYTIVDVGEVSEHRRLTEEEESVLRLAAKGRPGKLMSYDLEISEASISRHLGNAAAKLGARSNFEVVMLAARLGEGTLPVVEVAQLTIAEREILRLIRAGLSNAAIARIRNRSERTVANQVASVLRKTQSPSRRAVGTAVTRE